MKKTILTAYVALFLSFLLPIARLDRPAAALAAPSSTEEAAAETPPASPSPEPEPSPESKSPEPAAVPAAQSLRVLVDGTVTEMDMQDYLIGVVAAEMPAVFPEEALKAQAVAARSFALYCAAGHKHADADVCTDFRDCQAWQSDEALREKWGENYPLYRDRIAAAVEATRGQYLSYEGEPVFAAFHSSSAGATEDCGQVWNPRPYLVSVPSPESAETVPNFESQLICAALDFRDVILSAHPEADFSGPEAEWLGGIDRDESGRVSAAVIGGVSLRGTELRSLFSLRSTAFTLRYEEGRFTFDVLGYGHGVGMSQYGASVLAGQGLDYTAILAHYYPGTLLVAG